MRRSVHDSTVRFRANEELVAQAEAKARRSGMTLSELIRQAMRRELQDAA